MSKGPPTFSADGSQVKCLFIVYIIGLFSPFLHITFDNDEKQVIDYCRPASIDQMLLIHPMRHSPATGYFPQLAQKKADVTTVAGEKEPTALTHGTFYVTKIVAWDEHRHLV